MLQESKTNELEYQRLSKEEMAQRGILGRLVGICADFMSPTRNGRKYPEKLWENVFNDPIMKERIENGVCYGELGHPADREETDMEKIAVCMAEQPRKGSDGKLRAVFDILDTPNGRILKSLCDYGSTLGISSRGSGDLETDFDGQESVNPDTYNCEGFDVVLIPAVKEARLQYVNEALDKKRYNKTLREKLTESIKRETEENQRVINESLSTLGVTLDESQYKDNDVEKNKKKKYTVRYINSVDKSAYTEVEASSKEEARKLAKKNLGKECFRIHNVELSESLNKILSEGYNFETKPFDYTLYIDNESFPVNSANVIIPNGIKDNDGITYDLVICCLDEDENPINFETVAEAQSWIDEFSDKVKLECRGDTVYAVPQNTEWIDDQELDESVDLDESSLSPQEKMDLWHDGLRRENIKACSDAKLNMYRGICENSGYDEQVAIIDAEMARRNGGTANNTPPPQRTAPVRPAPAPAQPTPTRPVVTPGVPNCFMDDEGLHITADRVGRDFMSQFNNDPDYVEYISNGEFIIQQSDKMANKVADALVKVMDESELSESMIKQNNNDENRDIKPDTADDDGVMVEELQKSLDLNRKLDKKIVDLQEKLSVSYAKEMSLQEELEKYKSKVIKLSRRLAEEKVNNDKLTAVQDKKVIAEETCKQLTESVKTKTAKITSLKESVDKKKGQIASLNEQIQQLMSALDERNTQFESLTEKYETLNKDYQQVKENYSKKMEQQNALVEKYRGVAVKSVNKYIDTQATRLGISSAEIKNRLPESYSFTDIDRVCEDLQEYKLNISNLPFSTGNRLNEGMRIKGTNMNQKTLVPVEDDIDELTLRLAGL